MAKKQKPVELIIPVKLTLPKGIGFDKSVELLQQLVDVGLADAAESAEDHDLFAPDAQLAVGLQAVVLPHSYAVIITLNDKFPQIGGVEHLATKEEALDKAVMLSHDQGATDSPEQVRRQLDEEGMYIPDRYSDWAVNIVEL